VLPLRAFFRVSLPLPVRAWICAHFHQRYWMELPEDGIWYCKRCRLLSWLDLPDGDDEEDDDAESTPSPAGR